MPQEKADCIFDPQNECPECDCKTSLMDDTCPDCGRPLKKKGLTFQNFCILLFMAWAFLIIGALALSMGVISFVAALNNGGGIVPGILMTMGGVFLFYMGLRAVWR